MPAGGPRVRPAGEPVTGEQRPASYQVRVRGRLSETMLVAFPDLRPQLLASETVLAGELPDQAALFGVLYRIEALGLELLEVLRTQDH